MSPQTNKVSYGCISALCRQRFLSERDLHLSEFLGEDLEEYFVHCLVRGYDLSYDLRVLDLCSAQGNSIVCVDEFSKDLSAKSEGIRGHRLFYF